MPSRTEGKRDANNGASLDGNVRASTGKVREGKPGSPICSPAPPALFPATSLPVSLTGPRTTGMTGPLLREESLEPADERASFLAQGGCRSISDDLTIPFAGVLAYTFNAALRLRASP